MTPPPNFPPHQREPWYVKKNVVQMRSQSHVLDNLLLQSHVAKGVLKRLLPYLVLLGVFIVLWSQIGAPKFQGSAAKEWLILFLFLPISFFCYVYGIGKCCAFFQPKNSYENSFVLGGLFLLGHLKREEPRKGIPAPEMALSQFVTQVKAYALEKSFLKQTSEPPPENNKIKSIDNSQILKRRWNVVQDSVHEFEIYLANDPKTCIEKLIASSAPQMMDLSKIFRDVAETFDASWRRQGINIEQAIVTPLKASANELLLRRLLVGPWRSCVYFARRGSDVIFSAKMMQGKVITRWECQGISFPEEFYDLVKDSERSVNDRIEKGLEILHPDSTAVHTNSLFALISFVTWLDLTHQAGIDHAVKQGTEGLIIELRL